MCHLRSALQNYLSSTGHRQSDDNDVDWSPLRVHACHSSRCQDFQVVCRYMVEFIFHQFEQTGRVVSRKFERLGQEFSELPKIIKSKTLQRDTKVTLLETPDVNQVEAFLRSLFKYADFAPEIFINTAILLKRLLEKTSWHLRPTNWRILVILSLRITLKMEDRPLLYTSDIRELYPLFNAADLLHLERVYLRMVDYHCVITLEQYKSALLEIYAAVRSSNHRDTNLSARRHEQRTQKTQ